MGDTGGASRLDPFASQTENMDRKETQRSIVQIAIYIIKMESTEIQRTVLQVLIYNLKRKDGMKRTIFLVMMSY